MKFSVIIACYETEPYLQAALSSVERQTFADFEAICYVEESRDRSLEIAKSFAARDKRFIVATGPRSGAVATTRNYGIDHARGEYLVVLDGDDFLAQNALETMAKRISREGTLDVLAFAARSTDQEGRIFENLKPISNFQPKDTAGVFTGVEAIRRVGARGSSFNNFTPLSTYSVAFLRKNAIRQTDGVLMEDAESTPRIWLVANRFAYVDSVLYFYRRRENSITTSKSSRCCLDLMRQLSSLANFAETNAIPDDVAAIFANFWISLMLWFMYHPVTSAKVGDEARREGLQMLFGSDGNTAFSRLFPRASLPKRIARFFLLAAKNGHGTIAKAFFRKLYFPLIERRSRNGG